MNALPPPVELQCKMLLEQQTGRPILIEPFVPLPGGCINNGGKLITSCGTFFLKWNNTAGINKMFAAEATGLKLLNASGAVHVPEVVGRFEEASFQGIILELI